MDDGRVIGMQKYHSSGYLFGYIDSGAPRDILVGLMKQVEESRLNRYFFTPLQY